MNPGRARAAICILGLLVPARAVAQLGESRFAFLGTEIRSLRFEGLPGLKRLRQTAVPAGAVLPFGRLTLDLGASWVSTRLERPDGTSHSVDAFTDSQVRAALMLGRQAAVATVLVNLPTGLSNASAKDFTTIGAVSPGFLGFPAGSYASGFSVTSGLAGAVPAGNWSLGLAGSLRVNSRFTPYADANGPITYKPGLEAKIRGGADGLVGRSRLSLGVSYSTFGDDQFGQSATARGAYRPGPRWVVETALVAPVGNSSLALSLWNFRRSAGDTTGASARNKENLTGADASLSIPLLPWLEFEPLLEGRWSRPQSGSAQLLGAGAEFKLRLGGPVTLSPAFRYDTGWIKDPAGTKANIKGGSISVFVRVS